MNTRLTYFRLFLIFAMGALIAFPGKYFLQPLVNHSSPLVLMITMPIIALTLLWISEKIAGTDRLAFTAGPFAIGVLSGIGLKTLFVALM